MKLKASRTVKKVTVSILCFAALCVWFVIAHKMWGAYIRYPVRAAEEVSVEDTIYP